MIWKFHADRSQPEGDAIFVFGSNEAGRHGAGAAKQALKYGAKYGQGVGFSGSTYAIPTKDAQLKTLHIPTIRLYVDEFIAQARRSPDQKFFVTRIGCGLAGYRDAEIAPLFLSAPENCSFAEQWRVFLECQPSFNCEI